MEDIATDSQIPKYSLKDFGRHLLAFLLVLYSFLLLSQSPNKRAVKLTDKAEEAVRFRDFSSAKSMLLKAIDIDPSYIKSYLGLAAIFNIYQETDSACAYYNAMVRSVSDSEISQNLWNKIAGINYETGNYSLAQEALRRVNEPDSFLLKCIDYSVRSTLDPKDILIEELPPSINAFGLQYFPVLTIDENTIIYTKRDASDPSADEDIMISKKIKGEWIPAQSISPQINTRFNEGACSISADGSILIFTACEGRELIGSCDLFITKRVGNRWSKPENLGNTINSPYWDSQPALSADGRMLYFSSNRPGGFGKRDIWKSKYVDSAWVDPVNMGSAINTKWDEITPFIHSSNSTLFFSSQGHIGLGGFDIYYSHLKDSDCSAPVNLGFPINTKDEELSLFINASGNTAYFSKESVVKSVNNRSVLVKMPFQSDTIIQMKSSYVVGLVYEESTGKPLASQFRMYNLNDSTDKYLVSSDSITGKFYLVLSEGNEYGVFIEKSGYIFENLRFEPKESSVLYPDTINISLTPLKNGGEVILENIFFEINSATLNMKSKSSLDDIYNYLKKNSHFNFTIEGHTDSIGSDAYNLELSRRRALSVAQYLTDRGVDPKRITIKGLGSSIPLSSNQTEQGRKINRRITFRVTPEG
ncbi:MAG: OmpA family protein [Cyclobacteriaceae bacterium]